MPFNKYASLEKLLNPTSASPNHSSIKDGNLQIQIPIPLKNSDLDKMNRFKSLYSRLEKEPTETLDAEENFSEDSASAMQEAQNTYEMMMDIRKQLNQAYQEFMHMQ